MDFKTWWTPTFVRAPEDGAGAGGGDASSGAGETSTQGAQTGTGNQGANAGGADTGAGAGAGADTGGGTSEGAAWWKSTSLSDAQREKLTGMGLTVDDPAAAAAKLLDMEVAAQRKLGKPADQLMEKPADGQSVAEWLKENGDLFGVPESADKYEVKQPEGWPKDATWDTDLEAKARAVAHEHGLSGEALNAMVAVYADRAAGMMADAEEQLAQANAAMQTELTKDWGDQYGAKVAQAQQAASVVAEAAGLDQAALGNIASVLKPKVGDANVIKLFAAIGDMMSDDAASGLKPGGAGGLSTTPAEARAELQKLRAKGGAFYEATSSGDRSALADLKPKMERLTKIAAQGGGF